MPVPNKPPAKLQEAAPTPPLGNDQGKNSPASAQQALFADERTPAWRPATACSKHLWLCIHLPALPLEVLGQADAALAVFEDQHGIRKVLLADRAASAAGVTAGLSVNAALALVPALEIAERDRQRETLVLQELAGWAEKFTSFVSIAGPALLLLEIVGSLKLFGGIQALRQRIEKGLRSQGFVAAIAVAPTPLAATWLARANTQASIRDMTDLTGRLRPLPLACLDWPESVTASLRGMGISCVGECLRLPRQGFAKRFGSARLLDLDRAVGRLPDPRASFRAPERFSEHYEFTEEQNDRELLQNACETLLVKLERFLLTRQVAVQHIEFSFFHLQRPATHLSLGCVQAERAAHHWLQLLQLEFERLELSAPVIAIRLRGGKSEPFTANSTALPFHRQTGKCSAPMTHLAERLRARIGPASVHGVTVVAEHRPQYAWQRNDLCITHCAAAPGRSFFQGDAFAEELGCNNSLMLRRPLWVLAKPRRLSVAQGVPVCDGVLQLLDGPERLETGWWDGNGIARDYFIARNPKGIRLWIYRERSRGGDWYLEGMFG